MIQSKRTLQRSCIGALWLIVLLVAAIAPAQAQVVTITDENGIIYNIVDRTKRTVNVSAQNATSLASAATLKDVVIPATVIDHSTNATDKDPWNVTGMADRAFQKAAGLKSITIEAPFDNISSFCFDDCANLQSVTLPKETMKTIYQQAFYNCPNLKSVSGIDNVTRIQQNAFSKCSSLTDITLPSTLIELGAGAFQECSSLKEINVPGGIKTLMGSTFLKCTSLTTVTLGEGLETIGQSAFEGCTSLVHPSFPVSLANVNTSAFKKCDNLGTVTIKTFTTYQNEVYAESTIKEVEFPKPEDHHNVVLGAGLFKNVKGLKEVTVKGYTEVPASTFQGCTDLTTVTLTDNIGAVRNYAFDGCTSLTTVNMTKTLSTIDYYAFQNCTSLTDVTFPAKMAKIDSYAFNNCSLLKDITLPAGAELGSSVFANCNLKSITFPEEAMGKMSDDPFGKQPLIQKMTIPGWMKTVPNKIFKEWESLTEITFSEGVEVIGHGAAYNCDALTTITLPSTLTQIVDSPVIYTQIFGAFQQCDKLVNIRLTEPGENGEVKLLDTNGKLPDNLTDIGNYAFAACPGLTSIILPAKLNRIGYYAFNNCKQLEIPAFPESLKIIGSWAFSNCKPNGKVTLHKGMSIGEEAFSRTHPVEINLPKTIDSDDEKISFGNNVFYDNNNISTFTFPEWMDEIPIGFCKNWGHLETIVLPAKLTRIGEHAFYACPALHDVALPPTIKYLDIFCFASCGNLSQRFGSITLYEGTKVADNAFDNTTLTEIIFKGCADFGKSVFYNVKTIEKIAFPACMEIIPEGFCQGWTNLTEVTIPEGVKKISKNVFNNCTALKSVTIPASLDSICDLAFFNSGLASVTWPKNGIKGFGKNVFQNCKFEQFTIPTWLAPVPEAFLQGNWTLKELTWEPRPADEDSLVVKSRAFEHLGITNITFPEDKDIVLQSYAFYNCNMATEIQWPEKSKVIIRGEDAFLSCSKLTSLTIPDYMEWLPTSTFSGCSGIISLDMGKGMKKLGNSCFSSNTSLKSIKWSPVLEKMGSNCFSSSGLETLDFPTGIGEVSSGCFSSSTKLTKVTLPDDIELIDGSAFSGCTNLTDVNFPSSLTVIGGSAFKSDAKLTKIELNEGLETIGSNAFQYCTGLTTVYLPRSLKKLDNEAFHYCSNLETVTSDAEDLEINGLCFEGCTPLKSFISTGHVDYIGFSAFQNLKNFTDFICPEDDYVGYVGNNAFYNCSQLKAFPYLAKSYVGQQAFRGCTSLKSLTLPYQGRDMDAGNIITTTYIQPAFLMDATSVQSIVYPATAPYFHLYGCDISGAPLEAISYSYATDIVELYQTGSTSQERYGHTMRKYELTTNSFPTDIKATPEKSKLMVKRGEKWKYLEAGYGQLFSIDEMKEPQCNLTGDIFSTFDPEKNVNHYTVTLRWDVALSDLNADGETRMKIYRESPDGNILIADLLFSRPETNPATGDIEVNVTLNGKPNAFQGDFFYLAEGNNIYQTEHMSQGAKIIYDPVTEKRKELTTETRFISWFCLVDRFDSPDLNDAAKVPSTYKYHGEIEGYPYTELVNNDGYEVDEATGLRYHPERRTLGNIVSPSTTVYTAMALPSPYFQGIYTTDEVKADTDFALATTATPSTYQVEYNMTNPAVMKHVYRYKNISGSGVSSEPVLNGVEIKDVTDPGSPIQVGRIALNNASAPSGKVNIVKPSHEKRYQTVITSNSRGTFGSPVVSMPDVPSMTATLSVDFADHIKQTLANEEYDAHQVNDEGELMVPYTARITVPDLNASAMGYANGELTRDKYVLALRRNLSIGPWTAPEQPSARAAWDEYPETVMHFDGAVTGAHDTHCPDCAAADGVEVSDATGQITFTDTYDVATRHEHTVGYTPRVYIKIPASVNPGPDRWMIADSPQQTNLGIVTGVEDVLADGAGGYGSDDPSQVRWFDLRGVEVKDPQPGTLYLRVTPAGTSKAIFSL